MRKLLSLALGVYTADSTTEVESGDRNAALWKVDVALLTVSSATTHHFKKMFLVVYITRSY